MSFALISSRDFSGDEIFDCTKKFEQYSREN